MNIFTVLVSVVITISIAHIGLQYFPNTYFPSISDCVTEYYEIQKFITEHLPWHHQELEQSWKKAEANFHNEVEQMEVEFTNEERETWTQLKATIQPTLNSIEPTHPAVITVLMLPTADINYGIRFVKKIGFAINNAFAFVMGDKDGSHVTPEPMVISTSSFKGQSITNMRRDIESYFNSVGKSLLVLDVDRFENEEVLLMFHGICDNYHAVDVRATVIFLVQVPEHIFRKFEWRHSSAGHIAHEVYTQSWENVVRRNVGPALVARITDSVVLLNGLVEDGDSRHSSMNDEPHSSSQRITSLLKETLLEVEELKQSISQLDNLRIKLDQISSKLNEGLTDMQRQHDQSNDLDQQSSLLNEMSDSTSTTNNTSKMDLKNEKNANGLDENQTTSKETEIFSSKSEKVLLVSKPGIKPSNKSSGKQSPELKSSNKVLQPRPVKSVTQPKTENITLPTNSDNTQVNQKLGKQSTLKSDKTISTQKPVKSNTATLEKKSSKVKHEKVETTKNSKLITSSQKQRIKETTFHAVNPTVTRKSDKIPSPKSQTKKSPTSNPDIKPQLKNTSAKLGGKLSTTSKQKHKSTPNIDKKHMKPKPNASKKLKASINQNFNQETNKKPL